MHLWGYPYLLCLVLFSLVSCRHSKENDSTARYGIFTLSNQDSDVFDVATSLTSNGQIVPNKNADVDGNIFTYKNGFYYAVNGPTGDFVKYKVANGALVVEKRIPFSSVVSWEMVASWYNWVNDTTLFLGSSMQGKQFAYAVLDTKNLIITSSGKLDIPLPEKDFNYGGVMGRLVDNKLYVAYMLYQYENKKALPGDTIYLVTIDYPSMKTASITKDTRSTFPGGYILFWQVSLEFNGDIYFIAQPGGRLRRHPNYTSAVYRIKKGDNKLDPDYFFSLSNNTTQEAYGLYDLGNGKALTKIVDKTKVNQFSDYYESNIVNYYLVDLIKQSLTKVNLPIDRLDFHKNIITEGENAYIGIYAPDGKSTIWSYNVKNGKTSKGLKVNGQVLMIDDLGQ